MNHAGVLDKHDFEHSDRLREDIIVQIRAPGGLFFLSKYIYGFDRLNERVHVPLSKWIETSIREPHALLSEKDPRGAGKTTLSNISLPGWAFLQEEVPGTPIRGLNTRFAVVAPKRDLAAYGHVMTMRDLFDQCETWKALTYDIVIPRRDMWSLTHGLGFVRTNLAGGPNIMPMGMESIATGLHPHIFIVDDPINERNFQSITLIQQIKDWIIKSANLTESEQGARFFIGNTWALDDPQDWMRPETEVDGKRIFAAVKTWERGMESCEECLNGRARDHGESAHVGDIIPTLLDTQAGIPATQDDVERIKSTRDRVMLMAQYYNRPVAPGTLQFDTRDIGAWEWHDVGADNEPALVVQSRLWGAEAANEVRRGNPNFFCLGRSGMWKERIPLSALEIYILVDPAPSKEEKEGRSRFAVTVEGVERTGLRQFHLDEYASNAPPQKNLDVILDFWLKWFPYVKKIGIEAVAYQATIGDSVLDRARDRQIFTLAGKHVDMLPRLQAEGAQEDRIRYTLMPLFSGGNYYMHLSHRILRSEIATFGMAGSKHDLLDALSNLPRVRGRKSGGSAGGEVALAAAVRRRIPGGGA